MKFLKLLLVAFLAINVSFAQTDCKPYLPINKGATWEITNYTAKGKEAGKIDYELIDKIENGNNITFTVKTITFDKKGEQIYESRFEAKCIDGKFDFDMAFKMDGGALQAYENMDVKVDASKLEIPDLDTAPGTHLADGSLVVNIETGTIGMFKMTVLITDRVLEGRETVATSAGIFDCIVLSQKVSTKMMIKVQGSSKEWYAENIGIVRSESYNKKGKLMGYSVLTKLNN